MLVVTLALCSTLPSMGMAQDFSLHGYLDARLVAAPAATSWARGGLGKSRFGGGGTRLQFGGAALVGTAQLTPSLLALASVQLQTTDRPTVDALEAYLRYRPVSTSRWRWSVQAGAFFPPVSLENDAIGWTSPWTLTPSAINSWIGEEVRAVGSEFRLERRGDTSTWQMRAALFERNDPVGNVLAIRGWSLSDLGYGLGSRLREPDALVREDGGDPPERYDPFRRIGNRWGGYAELSWRTGGRSRISLLRYDNRADPSASAPYAGGDRLFAWRTTFWSLGGSAETGPVTWIAQAMDGDTIVAPDPSEPYATRFRAAFVLAGWNRGAWRPALRVDHFSTRSPVEIPSLRAGEHGNAVTAALNWRPNEWLRLTGELLRIDSRRTQRAEVGLPEHAAITQLQLSARLFF